jgi:hypothetical protein
MAVLGFTADASLYKSSQRYRMAGSIDSRASGGIVPQLRPATMLECWRCLFGNARPWECPPECYVYPWPTFPMVSPWL